MRKIKLREAKESPKVTQQSWWRHFSLGRFQNLASYTALRTPLQKQQVSVSGRTEAQGSAPNIDVELRSPPLLPTSASAEGVSERLKARRAGCSREAWKKAGALGPLSQTWAILTFPPICNSRVIETQFISC